MTSRVKPVFHLAPNVVKLGFHPEALRPVLGAFLAEKA
jgi:hypothetical protein